MPAPPPPGGHRRVRAPGGAVRCALRVVRTAGGDGHGVPGRHRHHRDLRRHAEPQPQRGLQVPGTSPEGGEPGLQDAGAVHVQGRAGRPRREHRPRRPADRPARPQQHRDGAARVQPRQPRLRAGAHREPRPHHRLPRVRPQRHHDRHAAGAVAARAVRAAGAEHLPGGLQGADQRQEDVPVLRDVRGARHPHLRVRRHPRAPHPVQAPARRAHRRGHVRLPRPHLRDAPRLRSPGPSWP